MGICVFLCVCVYVHVLLMGPDGAGETPPSQ